MAARSPPSRRRKREWRQAGRRQDGGPQPAARGAEAALRRALGARLGSAAGPSPPGGWVRGRSRATGTGGTAERLPGCPSPRWLRETVAFALFHHPFPPPKKRLFFAELVSLHYFVLLTFFFVFIFFVCAVVEVTEGNTTTVSLCPHVLLSSNPCCCLPFSESPGGSQKGWWKGRFST